MATKRGGASTSSPTATHGVAPVPVRNALAVASAVGYGLWVLVGQGRMEWPPRELLAGAYTLAGCLALAGPLVLARRDREGGSGGSGLGELAWLSGGLVVWIFNLASAVQGDARALLRATPIGARSMGLIVMAVVLAGWRLGSRQGRGWSWTNVTGWVLGLFWIGLAVWSLVPERIGPVASAAGPLGLSR